MTLELSVDRWRKPASVADADAAPRFRIVPARHPERVFGTIVAAILVVALLQSVFGNPRWGWDVFAQWFFAEPILQALGLTLVLTVLGAVFGFALGAALALARISKAPLLSGLAWTYTWLFRSIPLLVLMLLLNNLGYLYETVALGVPFTQITFFSYSTTRLISPFMAGVIGLALNEAAFSAEIIRGGILSVDQRQLEAAAALGLPRRRQIFNIVLPQAMRSIIPAAFNDIINLAKGSSLVYILALPELFYTVQVIYRRNLEVVPLLMVATVWYLAILTVLSVVQRQIERHFARGALSDPPKSVFQRLDWRKRSAATAATVSPAPAVGQLGDQDRGGGEVVIRDVVKSYGHLRVLDGVSVTFPAGSVTVVLGQSGSGKSTLLRLINHLERVDGGYVSIDGEFLGYRREENTLYELRESEILRRRADVGMVFQSFNLFPHLTILENIIEAPIAVRGLSREAAVTLALGLLARVGLLEKAHAYPRQLSGGQQQRVAIARALALKPKVLLFDEPTSALDPELVNEVLDVIKELAHAGVTLVVVTHEIGFAREVADTVLFMEAGRILEAGPPEQVLANPAHPRTAEFLSKVL